MTTHYDVLGISPDASSEAIQAAYRRLAKLHHPDITGGDGERFKRISEAYDVLRNSTKRHVYNALLAAQKSARSSAASATASAAVASDSSAWARGALGVVTALCGFVAVFYAKRLAPYQLPIIGGGFAMALIGWRIGADRHRPLRNPLVSLYEGVLIVALGALLAAWRILTFIAGMMMLGGGVAAIQWLAKHLH